MRPKSSNQMLDWFMDGMSINDIIAKLAADKVIDCRKLTPEQRIAFVEETMREQLLARAEMVVADFVDLIDEARVNARFWGYREENPAMVNPQLCGHREEEEHG